jgi:hypothetical protein
MHTPSAAELLKVWERGLAQPLVERAIDLLAVAYAETDRESIAHWSIGRRDAGLLQLREMLMGPHLSALVACPHCAHQLELAFNVSEILAQPSEGAESYALDFAGYIVRFRLPNSSDVAAIATETDLQLARQQLFYQCVLQVSREGESTTADQLPEDVILAVGQRMALIDAQADVQLALTCPGCAHAWAAAFDIVSYLWSEINAWAVRMLREIHLLASAYGWREADILALSPLRRQLYLEMIGA